MKLAHPHHLHLLYAHDELCADDSENINQSTKKKRTQN